MTEGVASPSAFARACNENAHAKILTAMEGWYKDTTTVSSSSNNRVFAFIVDLYVYGRELQVTIIWIETKSRCHSDHHIPWTQRDRSTEILLLSLIHFGEIF